MQIEARSVHLDAGQRFVVRAMQFLGKMCRKDECAVIRKFNRYATCLAVIGRRDSARFSLHHLAAAISCSPELGIARIDHGYAPILE